MVQMRLLQNMFVGVNKERPSSLPHPISFSDSPHCLRFYSLISKVKPALRSRLISGIPNADAAVSTPPCCRAVAFSSPSCTADTGHLSGTQHSKKIAWQSGIVAYLSRGQALFSGESGLLEEQQRRPPQAQISFNARAQTVDNIIYDCQEIYVLPGQCLDFISLTFTFCWWKARAHDSNY